MDFLSDFIDLFSDAPDAADLSDAADLAETGWTGGLLIGGSGPEIMGTLARAGALIGGSVLTGTAWLAGAAGFGASSLMNNYLFDGDEISQYATKAGSVIGVITSVGTLLFEGAGPTALSAIGGIFGGGMAAGGIALLAAPTVLAVVFGGAAHLMFGDD